MERLPGRDELVGGRVRGGDGPVRRWPAWVGAAVVVVVAGLGVALARPDLSLLSEPGASPSEGEPRPGARQGDGPAWVARGDLTGSRDFVDAALQRIREERPAVSRLYFAGRLSDSSRLVLAGADGRAAFGAPVHALHVPAGVPLEGARVVEATALLDPQQVLAWAARGRDGHVRVVALTRPGRPVRFEVSARVEFGAADGVPSRAWQPVRSRDGAAVADLGDGVDPVIALRARGPGVFTLPVVVRVDQPAPASPALAVEGVHDPGYRGPDPRLLSRALREQAGAVVELRSARRTVLWSGVPWMRNRMVLILLTRPDGRRFQVLVGQQGGSAYPAGVRALATGAPDRLPWLLEPPFSPRDPTLLLLPTGEGAVIHRRPGQPARTLQVGPDGVVELVDPGPSAPLSSPTLRTSRPSAIGDVTVADPAGRILLRTRLPRRGFDDPLALR